MAASPPGLRRSTDAFGHRSLRPALIPRRVQRRRADVLRRAAERKLDEIAGSDRPIVAGPWTGGVGLELLYWIPLLGWLTTAGGVDPERVVAISRGGADRWYADVASTYIDLLDHFSASRVNVHGSGDADLPRQVPGGARFEVSALQLGRDAAGTERVDWLHPSLLWRLFGPRWNGTAPGSVVWDRTLHRLLPSAADGAVEPSAKLALPDSYVALKASFNRSFPDTPDNRAFLDELIAELSGSTEVVLLRPPDGVDDGSSYVPRAGSVHDLSDTMTLRSNLDVQTRIVRGSQLFVSVYGGFSYIGTYVGTPTLALYSRAAADAIHLDTIDRVGRRLAGDGTRLFRARHIGAIRLGRAG